MKSLILNNRDVIINNVLEKNRELLRFDSTGLGSEVLPEKQNLNDNEKKIEKGDEKIQ